MCSMVAQDLLNWGNCTEKSALDRSFNRKGAYVCSLCMHDTSFSINEHQRGD